MTAKLAGSSELMERVAKVMDSVYSVLYSPDVGCVLTEQQQLELKRSLLRLGASLQQLRNLAWLARRHWQRKRKFPK